MVFNESIENVEQTKLRNKKQLYYISLDLKIYFIYTVHLYRMKKILHLNLYCRFFPPKIQNSIERTRGYRGHFF